MIGVSVVITTHNRTRVAQETIKFMVRNFRYKNVKWIISDDRSDPGHIESLVETFKECGVENVTVCRTDSKRYGLGASLNNGLREAFKFSDIVLTMEDDWILEKPFNPAYYIKYLHEQKNVSCIRLAAVNHSKIERYGEYFDKIVSGDNPNLYSTFNLQVAFRKKSIYDKLGYYVENCKPDKVERDFIYRYNKYTNGGRKGQFILIPGFIKQGTLDDKSLLFTHVGKSTIGHSLYTVPKRFQYLYNEENTKNEHEKQKTDHFFKIIVPTYNSSKFVRRCINSVLSQTFKDFSLVIVDDCSNDGTWEIVQEFGRSDERIVIHRMETNSFSGKCRNWGIENGPTGDYILFLDSDDNYSDINSLQTMFDIIRKNNFPDVVKCSFSYVNAQNGKREKKLFKNSPESLIRFEAPWTMASKNEICSRFQEGIKKFNDVIWNLKTLNNSKTWAVVTSPIVDYHINENPLSLQYGFGRNDVDSIISVYKLIDNLKKLKVCKAPIVDRIRYLISEKQELLKRLSQVKSLDKEFKTAKDLFQKGK